MPFVRWSQINVKACTRGRFCIGGKEAAEIFYDDEKFLRNGVAPKRVQKTLFGVGGVQSLDNEAHRHRKEMFMSKSSDQQVELVEELNDEVYKLQASMQEMIQDISKFRI